VKETRAQPDSFASAGGRLGAMSDSPGVSCGEIVRRVVLGSALFGFSAWLGFVMNIQHGPPGGAPAPAPHLPREKFHGLRAPKSRIKKKAKDDDDLDMKIHARLAAPSRARARARRSPGGDAFGLRRRCTTSTRRPTGPR